MKRGEYVFELPVYRILRSLTLEGGFTGRGTEKSGETHIRQLGGDRAIIVHGTAREIIQVTLIDIHLEDGLARQVQMVLTNGAIVPPYKGGLIYSRYAKLRMKDMHLQGGKALAAVPMTAFGGGIYIEDGELELDHVSVTGCRASTSGGGLANAGGIVYLDGENVFQQDTAPAGGGISLLANAMLYRRNGWLWLSKSDFHVSAGAMDPSTIQYTLFHDRSLVLIEESHFTPEEEFPYLRKTCFKEPPQFVPGSSGGVAWRVGAADGPKVEIEQGWFLSMEGSELSFQLIQNGTPVPENNLRVSAGTTKETARRLYEAGQKGDYRYTINVTEEDSIFSSVIPAKVPLTLEANPDSVYLLSIIGANKDSLVCNGIELEYERYTPLRVRARPKISTSPAAGRRLLATLRDDATGAVQELTPISMSDDIATFELLLTDTSHLKVYIPPYDSLPYPSPGPMLWIDSLTVKGHYNGKDTSYVEHRPFLRPLQTGTRTIELHVTTTSNPFPYQYEVALRKKTELSTPERFKVDALQPVITLPTITSETEVVVYLPMYPQVRDSFTINIYDPVQNASVRVRKGVMSPLPLLPGLSGTLQWSIPEAWTSKTTIAGDSVKVDSVGTLTINGEYHRLVYNPLPSGMKEVEVDVVDLQIVRIVRAVQAETGEIEEKEDVITKGDCQSDVLKGQSARFKYKLLSPSWSGGGQQVVSWSVEDNEEGIVSVLPQEDNEILLNGLKGGVVTLRATLNDPILSNGFPISSFVRLRVGGGFGPSSITGDSVVTYHHSSVVRADISEVWKGSLSWGSWDTTVMTVTSLGEKEALLNAVGYGKVSIWVTLTGTGDTVSRVFYGVGLEHENKEASGRVIPVAAGAVYPLPCRLLSREEGDLLIWKVEPEALATVTGNRLYFNEQYGKVTVTAQSLVFPEISETFTYNIIRFDLDKKTLELNYAYGANSITGTLKCLFEGTGTADINVMWKIADPEVVEIKEIFAREKELLLTLPMPPRKQGGQTTVTVFCVENPQLTASCVVTAKQITPTMLYVEAVTPPPYLTGEIYHFEGKITNWLEVKDLSEYVGWRTFDPEVIRIYPGATGVWVQALTPGTATLQAYLLDNPEGLVFNLPLTISTAGAGVYLKESYLKLPQYGSYALEYAPFPNDLSTVAIEWKSSDKEIVDVMAYQSSDGQPRVLLLTYQSGEAVVTGTIRDVSGQEYSSSCVVQVLTPVESLTLEATNRVLWLGETYALEAKVYPPTATRVDSVIYESLDPAVAKVDGFGIVEALSPGKAIIRARVKGEEPQAFCYVTVAEPSAVGVVVSPYNVSLNKGEEQSLSVAVIPYLNTSDITGVNPIKWSSSDPAVATVGTNGKVLAISEGVAYIRASTADGWNSQECLVQVTVPPFSLLAPEAEMTLRSGLRIPLKDYWTILPSDASLCARPDWGVWEVEDTTVLEIDAFGVALAKNAGSTRVTVKLQGFPQLSASTRVVVTPYGQGLSLTPASLTLRKGERSTLYTSGAEGPLEWQSSDTAIVTVDLNGNIRTVRTGTAVVTAIDGEASASCVVTVGVFPEALFLTPYEPSYMHVGEQMTLTATVIPQEADVESLLWAETNTSLFNFYKVGNKCTLEAVRTGDAVIYVASPDGTVFRSWMVSVREKTATADITPDAPKVSYLRSSGELLLQNLQGYRLTLYTLSGLPRIYALLGEGEVRLPLPLPQGIYLLRAVDAIGRHYSQKLLID
jgi:uncharacterized protein YjdB